MPRMVDLGGESDEDPLAGDGSRYDMEVELLATPVPPGVEEPVSFCLNGHQLALVCEVIETMEELESITQNCYYKERWHHRELEALVGFSDAKLIKSDEMEDMYLDIWRAANTIDTSASIRAARARDSGNIPISDLVEELTQRCQALSKCMVNALEEWTVCSVVSSTLEID
jgi:hypothetical protein